MIRLLAGDCRDVLRTLPAESVQCVVTSPPYYGLRDYGTALWDGGDAACDHSMAISEGDPVPPSCRQCRKCGRLSRTKWLTASTVRSECDQCEITTDYTDVDSRGTWLGVKRDADGDWTLPSRRLPGRMCRCGAVRVDRQIGLEATPDEYLATMVGVFREVRRVLRRDGTCWVNMGDSYNANQGSWWKGNEGRASPKVDSGGLAAKQLLLMPARLALALQADGWWVRSAIVWSKPNPMPESVSDRPTSAHEHVFLLTRSARYYYDADAVREGITESTAARYEYPQRRELQNGYGKTNRWGGDNRTGDMLPADVTTRNLRNVWTIATHAYPEAHFATFPPELAERCIKAGTSERGCCAVCGKPWVRVTERNLDNVPTRMATKRAPVDGRALGAYLRERRQALGCSTNDLAIHFPSITGGLTGCVRNWELGLNTPTPEQWTKLKDVLALDDRFDEQIYGTVEVVITDHSPSKAAGVRTYAKAWNSETETTGWSPGCQCNAETVPCVVLDPFIGSGTTALVADRLQRDCIGIDLNVGYTRMAMDRCIADAPLFTSFLPAEPPEDARMADLFTDMAAE